MREYARKGRGARALFTSDTNSCRAHTRRRHSGGEARQRMSKAAAAARRGKVIQPLDGGGSSMLESCGRESTIKTPPAAGRRTAQPTRQQAFLPFCLGTGPPAPGRKGIQASAIVRLPGRLTDVLCKTGGTEPVFHDGGKESHADRRAPQVPQYQRLFLHLALL